MAKTAVPVFLAKLVVPGGAFLSVAEGIWATIMTFVEKGKQIVAVGQAFLASVQRIAAGDLGPAAQKVEDALMKLLPVALGFLARWLHLDGIVGKVQDGLEKVRRPVEKGVDKVLDKVAEKAGPVWARMQAGVGKLLDKGRAAVSGIVGKVKGWLGFRKPFTTPAGETHTLFVEGSEAHARLMVASTPQPAGAYLKQQRQDANKLDGDKKKAQLKLIGQAETQLAAIEKNTIPSTDKADALRTFAELLAQIGGLDRTTIQNELFARLPEKATWTFGPPKTAYVEYLSVKSANGGTPTSPTTGLVNDPSWTLLQTFKLTKGSAWVQMHLITAGVGGRAEAQNLVPAPGPTNTGGRVRDFETALEHLVKTPKTDQQILDDAQKEAKRTGNPPPTALPPAQNPAEKTNLVWATVAADFHPAGQTGGNYPKRIVFDAGLYYYHSNAWVKDLTPRLHAQVDGIKPPDFTKSRPLALNDAGEISLHKATGCPRNFTRLVAKELKAGPFANPFDIRKRMKNHYKMHGSESEYTENIALLFVALRAGTNFVELKPEDRLKQLAKEAAQPVAVSRITLN